MPKSKRKGRMRFHLKPVQWLNNSETACAVGHVAKRRVRAPANVAVVT